MRAIVINFTLLVILFNSYGQDTLNIIFFDTSSFTYGHLLYPVEGAYTFSQEKLRSKHYPTGFQLINPRELTGNSNLLTLTSFRDSVPQQHLRKITSDQSELFRAYSEEYLFHKKYKSKPEFMEKNSLFLDTILCEYLNPVGDILLEDTPVFFDMTFLGTDTLRRFRSYLKLSDSIRQVYQPQLNDWTQSFLFKETEVTNREYRLFVNYVRDSIAIWKLYDSLDFEIGKQLLNCDKKTLRRLTVEHKQEYLMRYGLNVNYFNETKENDYYREDFIPVLSSMYLPQTERYYKRMDFDTDKFIYRSSNGQMIPVYPDTTCWRAVNSFEKSWKAHMYFWHPGFGTYPVVGLNLHQMLAYCEWYERKINQEMHEDGQHYQVSLPELHHYEMAAKLVSPIELRNQITVYPPEALTYQRDEWDADAYICESKLLDMDHPINGAEIKFNKWLKLNGTFPLYQLLGGVSEVCILPGRTLDRITILGGDRYLGLFDPNEVQINTLFHQRTIDAATGYSTVGFRPVITIE